ncbi:MAG: MCP four helix bundle domain-containing protein [Deltaproteobacteria bacterium]|nr:MCP four helix bundle domain-containing protein [Deltaproteobacteria bacterium]
MLATLGRAHEPRGWLLGAALAAILIAFLVSNVVALLDMRAALRSSRVIVEDALVSIEMVSRLDADIDQERLLIDARIAEKNPDEIRRIEQKLADVNADFDVAALAYEPIATFPGEHETWTRVQHEAQALRAPLRHALELSRHNHPEEARAQMQALQDDFEHIDDEIDQLVGINQAAAQREVAETATKQRHALWLMVGLTATGLAVGVVLAVVLSRFIRGREAELLQLAHALEERNRELDSFSGRVAHDLRGPLTVVNLAAGRLAERAPQELGTTALLQRGVTRMEILIQDLLMLSRIGSELHDAVCDPSAVVALVRDELSPQLSSEGGTLSASVESAEVVCAAGLLRQALWNIVENALKYRRRDVAPEIQIQGQILDDVYELRVSDNGLGMSAEDARHAFEPFYRAERTRTEVGTGLGLAIVKRIVDAYGGALTIDSQINSGTTLRIKLRVANGRRHEPSAHLGSTRALRKLEQHPPA